MSRLTSGTRRVEPKSVSRFLDTAVLEVISGPGAGARVEVGSAPVLVGRDGGCQIVLADARVSATHLELRATPEGVRLRDLETTNGTFVGSLRVREALALDGTEIRIGDSVLRLAYDDTPSKVSEARAGKLHGLVGRSAAMRELYASIDRIATTHLSVLVEAETGSGKEEVARAMHASSPRADGPFVIVDCGAIAPSLLESTLFGHEKGSFSGATDRRVGLVEAADGGTLFLDELGELPLEAQTRLLRLIEARTFRRIGSTKDLKANVRFVSATHRDLPAMVSKGSFRADLFFRLATARVRIPPLRERIDDLPELVVALAKRMELAPPKLDETTLALLSKRPWPGNVRELRNLVELLGATVPDGRVTRAHLDALPPTSFAAPPPAPAPVREEIRQPSQAEGVPALFRDEKERANEAFERAYLARVLALHPGNVSHQAAHAGLVRHHWRALVRKHGLDTKD
ncbi:MAG: sigma 54-interacting transcriptional regulator [Deltaproteobacteria bacterium]